MLARRKIAAASADANTKMLGSKERSFEAATCELALPDYSYALATIPGPSGFVPLRDVRRTCRAAAMT